MTMKKEHMFIYLGIVLSIIGCASNASNTSGESPGPSQANADVVGLASTSQSQETSSEASKTSETNTGDTGASPIYFLGDGGKGKSLGILVPESSGLAENQSYLPRMVQGCLVSNMSRYSAITVLDRVSLDKVIAETLDPAYKDNLDIVSLGHVAQVGYMMTGNITRTSSGYALQLNVTDTTPNAATIASYSGTCTVAQFDDFSAIHQASKELLAQMGVQLNDAAISELDKASSAQTISAQTNLAQGIVAQQKGTVVEAMAYYYDAVSFDPQLSEASGRLSALSSDISGGNIGENVRNDIQRRNEWIKILREAEDFFSKHLPFELVYSNSLTQGKIDYAKETVELKTSISLKPFTNSIKIFDDILAGLEATGRRQDWELGLWPILPSDGYNSVSGIDSSIKPSSKKIFPWLSRGNRSRLIAGERINVDITLINENGNTISKANVLLKSRIEFAESDIRVINDDNPFGIDRTRPDWDTPYNYRFRDEYTGNVFYYDRTKLVASDDKNDIVFANVNANNITDNLTIKIVSVNGVDIAKNPDYIRVTATP